MIKQKGLPKKCQVLAKAVVRRSEALKNLQEAAESQDTVSMTVDVMNRKVEIEQTQQMLQEAQEAHDKALTKLYEQLRNLLSGNTQSQWDCVCCEMHKCDSWAAVNCQVTNGRRPQTWTSFLDCLELHKLTVFSADAAERQRFYMLGLNNILDSKVQQVPRPKLKELGSGSKLKQLGSRSKCNLDPVWATIFPAIHSS